VETRRKDFLLDNVSQITRDYELMTILVPDMAEEDTAAEIERIRGFITDVQGEITEVLVDSPWGRRRLAYTIRHEGVDYRDGFYTVTHFSALPTAISDLERELKLDTNVIRYLLVMDDPKAGEKNTEQPQGEDAATEGATADTEVATPVVEDEASETAAEETPVDAPASGTEATIVETPAADTEQVEEAADAVQGEDEPAPADGADDKEA
jgi:small subunit ribosomal protein S6